jgi:hypothetical protein
MEKHATCRDRAFPSPRNPGLPGFRINMRKSGEPDLRWGGVGVGVAEDARVRCRLSSLPPPTPTLPHKGGGSAGAVRS